VSDQLSAQVSNLLFVVAIAVYVLAMIGFAADLAGSAQRHSDARLARRERARERVAASGGSGVAVLEHEAPADEEPSPTTSGGMSAGSFALVMTTAAAAMHLVAVILRGVATHRVPWSNMYEFAMTGSAVVVIVFLVVVARRRDMRVLGTFIVLPMLILMLIAQLFWYLPAAALPPSLQNSHWLVIHVLIAILATALLTVGAVASVLQLIQARREKNAAAMMAGAVGGAGVAGTATDAAGIDETEIGAADGTEASTAGSRRGGRFSNAVGAVMDRLPSSSELEAFAFRIHAVGFVLWTFTLIFGAIWASNAWGRYWGWDPKEVWTFVVWVVYAAYLHARATVGFRGNRAAWFALVGFACIIFNFTIVNTVINGLHSYSGLT